MEDGQWKSDVPGCIRDMLRPAFATWLFQKLSTVVPFGSHFHLLRGCFWPPFPRSFGGAELAITSGFTPQSSCIHAGVCGGCRYSAALCVHVGAACGVGRYVAIANIHPDSESEWQQNMIGFVGVTPLPSQSCLPPQFPGSSNF